MKFTARQLLLPLIFSALLLQQCSTEKKAASNTAQVKKVSAAEYNLQAVLYHQQAAEYKALCYQAYNLARLSLVKNLGQRNSTLPAALVVDIDETILDNSPYNAKLVIQDSSYTSATWRNWTALGAAKPVPGALEFLKYADSLKVAVFYISNRGADELKPTLQNLQNFGFPQAIESRCLFKTTSSDKESRRQEVLKNYDIVLLAGDNLNDFTNVFEKQLPQARDKKVDELHNEFGSRFIILPNPMYGDWENALYQYNYKLTPAQKDSVRRSVLQGY